MSCGEGMWYSFPTLSAVNTGNLGRPTHGPKRPTFPTSHAHCRCTKQSRITSGPMAERTAPRAAPPPCRSLLRR
ncbi:unnamed protein product, partial [Ixodes pacificus]